MKKITFLTSSDRLLEFKGRQHFTSNRIFSPSNVRQPYNGHYMNKILVQRRVGRRCGLADRFLRKHAHRGGRFLAAVVIPVGGIGRRGCGDHPVCVGGSRLVRSAACLFFLLLVVVEISAAAKGATERYVRKNGPARPGASSGEWGAGHPFVHSPRAFSASHLVVRLYWHHGLGQRRYMGHRNRGLKHPAPAIGPHRKAGCSRHFGRGDPVGPLGFGGGRFIHRCFRLAARPLAPRAGADCPVFRIRRVACRFGHGCHRATNEAVRIVRPRSGGGRSLRTADQAGARFARHE